MPAMKKRKVTTTATRNLTSSTRGITAFTKISKAQVTSKDIYDKTDRLDVAAGSLIQKIEQDRKRKLLVAEEVKDDHSTHLSSEVIESSPRHVKPLPRRLSQKTPQTPNKTHSISTIASSIDTPENTPTKGAQSLLVRLALSSSSPTITAKPPSITQESSATDFYLARCRSERESCIAHRSDQLPGEILDLINLHASFLTALSLHHAHNGIHTPADLRLLCPDVARAWGKRKVLLDDVRRVLGVLNTAKDSSGLTLSDYGHGKICIESLAVNNKAGSRARPLDENLLNDAFVHSLRELWRSWEGREKTKDNTATAFIETLPLETITICSSLSKMSPLLAKGQRRLEDLKAGMILKKGADEENSTAVVIKEEEGRRPTLLERLKAKQLQRSMLPPPPSKQELGRRAALHRLEEVVSVLSLLTTSTSVGQARVSFTVPTVLGKLRDSFKTPMSREEGDLCIRLLASDIAPEWLRVVKMGKVDAIVVNRDNRPSDMDIRERVKRAV